MKDNYSRKEVIDLFNSLLLHCDKLEDAIYNEDSNWNGESLFEVAEETTRLKQIVIDKNTEGGQVNAQKSPIDITPGDSSGNRSLADAKIEDQNEDLESKLHKFVTENPAPHRNFIYPTEQHPPHPAGKQEAQPAPLTDAEIGDRESIEIWRNRADYFMNKYNELLESMNKK